MRRPAMDSETLSRLKDVELEIALEIRRICEQNEIKYFLDSGTLLGAVRHKGFIPWDDDVDIGMLREEYEKFIEIAPTQLNEKYYLQTWKTDKTYPWAFAKVRKKGTLYIETAAPNATFSNEIFVDIFPYDTYPTGTMERLVQGKKIMNYRRILMMKSKMTPWRRNKSALKRIGVYIKYLPYIVQAVLTNKDKIVVKYNKVMKAYNSFDNLEFNEDGLFVESKGFDNAYFAAYLTQGKSNIYLMSPKSGNKHSGLDKNFPAWLQLLQK